MIRRILPVVAAAALFGACSSSTSNTPEPGAPSTTRAADEGARGGPGGPGGRRGGPGGPGQREDMVMRGITLTAAQQERIETIRASYRKQMEDLRQGGGDRAAMRERMQPLMEKQQAEVRAVLTAEQQVQFDRNVAEMRERMQQGGGRRPNG